MKHWRSNAPVSNRFRPCLELIHVGRVQPAQPNKYQKYSLMSQQQALTAKAAEAGLSWNAHLLSPRRTTLIRRSI
jgi:hypothetical protein